MIKNYYWAMAVMAAFVAGTIATATPVFAPPPGDDDDGEGGWKLAVAGLQEQIDTIGTVSCEDITGSADLCDGVDDVGDGGTGPVLGFYPVERIVELQSGTTGLLASAFCDSEDIAVSGPFEYRITNSDGDPQIATLDTFVQFSSNEWHFGLTWDEGTGDESSTVTLGALCADFDPPHNNAD